MMLLECQQQRQQFLADSPLPFPLPFPLPGIDHRLKCYYVRFRYTHMDWKQTQEQLMSLGTFWLPIKSDSSDTALMLTSVNIEWAHFPDGFQQVLCVCICTTL